MGKECVMRFNLFRKDKKKSHEEKSHREPIVVRIFREDSDNAMTVTFTGDSDKSDGDSATDPSSSEGKRTRVHFVPNQKYFNISVYAMFTFTVLMLLAVVIFNFTAVTTWIRKFFNVLTPFWIGALIAFIVSPIINWLDDAFFEKVCKIHNSKLRTTLSLIITYIVLLGLLVMAVIVLIPQLIGSLQDLMSRSRALYDIMATFFSTLEERFPTVDFSYVTDSLSTMIPNLISTATEWLRTSIPKVVTFSYSIFKGVVNFLLTIAISIYLVCDRRRIAKGSTEITYALLKPNNARSVIQTARECGQIFFGFIVGKSIDSIIIGILCFIILSIVGLPYPVLISVVVGVTNMIPFFGPFIGAIPSILLYLCIDPFYAFIFAIIIFGLQQFDGWVLGPVILGDSTGIRPVWVIVGITVGGAYFGFGGMFLGVPVTAVIVYLLSLALAKRLKKRKIEVS